MPATPPPITRACLLTGITFSLRGLKFAGPGYGHAHQLFGFWPWPPPGSSECTQESWLRILAISNRYLFRPQASRVLHEHRLMGLGAAGGHHHPVQRCSLIISLIFSWVSWEQVNRFWSGKDHTAAGSLAYSCTAGNIHDAGNVDAAVADKDADARPCGLTVDLLRDHRPSW